jgi:hypothetical protein
MSTEQSARRYDSPSPRRREKRGAEPLGATGLVLLAIHRHPGAQLHEIVPLVNLTERRVQQVVAELIGAGVLRRVGWGRGCYYEIQEDARLMSPPLMEGVMLSDWLSAQPLPEPAKAGRIR